LTRITRGSAAFCRTKYSRTSAVPVCAGLPAFYCRSGAVGIPISAAARAALAATPALAGGLVEIRENQLVVVVLLGENISTGKLLRRDALLLVSFFGRALIEGLGGCGIAALVGLGMVAVGERVVGRLVVSLFDRIAQREDARFDLDDRRITTVLFDHGGEPRAHGGFRGFTDVRKEILLDRDFGDFFVVEGFSNAAENLHGCFRECH